MLNNDFNNNFLEDEMDDDEEQINSSSTKTVFNDPLAEVAGNASVGHIPSNNENKNTKEQNCKIVGLTAEINNYDEKQIDSKTVDFYQVTIGFQKN